MRFETPAGNKITLSEEDKAIKITDQNGNKIEMTEDGIKIESGKAIQLKAGTELTLESGTAFSAKGGSELKLEGTSGVESITLLEGDNILMAAVAETHEEWGFYAGIENDQGLTIKPMKPVLKPPVEPLKVVNESANLDYPSFLGTGWSFPPEFILDTGKVVMTADEVDIEASLRILFGTAMGERFMNPRFGLDMHDMLFEPMSTTLKTLLQDQVKMAILIYEPRIKLLTLDLDTPNQYEGKLSILVEYEVRSTNSRYNLVYPFNTGGGNA